MIYLDNNATTPVDPRVVEYALPFLTESYGNASSTHPFGQRANGAVNQAREHLARLLNAADSEEIFFTSGATEALNLAIKGVAELRADRGRHLVTVQTEHPAVLDCHAYLEQRGYEVTYLPVLPDGLLDLNALRAALRPDTVLVSVMAVNNETGVIQPIREIAALAHERGALSLTDATQAVGKLPLDVRADGVDLLTFSGHKFHAPKGVGGLYVRGSKTALRLPALLHGGGHEKGLRSGTLNVFGIAAMGYAAHLATGEMNANAKKVGKLRDALEAELLRIEGACVNGSTAHRLHNVTNLYFPGVDAEALFLSLPDLALSNGSACSSASLEPSHALKAMGRSDDEAFQSVRFSLSAFNTEEEIQTTARAVRQAVEEMREMIY